jgi:hypothetical protein
MPASSPLSTPLSRALIAFTIELDNEFERRFAESGIGRRFGISLVMWSNFLRFVDDGITVGELPGAAGLPKARVLSALGGMERWRYVFVTPGSADPPPESKRDGFGSARGLRSDWVVRPTPAGRKAEVIWRPLLGEVETRWEERFGRDEIDALRRSLGTIVEQVDLELPEYLPIVVGQTGMVAEIEQREARGTPPRHLSALLAQGLLAYTLDFERESELSLPLSANVVRVLDDEGIDVRELPRAVGVSPEATSMALRFLAKSGHVAAANKRARLTPKGLAAQEAARVLHRDVEQRWTRRFGAESVKGLRAALEGVLEQRDGDRPRLSLGLDPHPDGWRATKRYVEQTNAVFADPLGRLPHYPMVLHRGGWPDGS